MTTIATVRRLVASSPSKRLRQVGAAVVGAFLSACRSVVGKGVQDAAGDLLQRHFGEYFRGTFTDPDTGLVVLWTRHDTVVRNLGQGSGGCRVLVMTPHVGLDGSA